MYAGLVPRQGEYQAKDFTCAPLGSGQQVAHSPDGYEVANMDMGVADSLDEAGVQTLSGMDRAQLTDVVGKLPQHHQLLARKLYNGTNDEWAQDMKDKKLKQTERRKEIQEAESALHEAKHALGKAAATSAASDAEAAKQAVENKVEALIKEAATKLGAPADWKLEDVKDDTSSLIKHLLGEASAELSVKNNFD